MNRKQIETSKEARLWVTQVIFPAAAIAATVLCDENARERIKSNVAKVRDRFTDLRRRKNDD